jgi:hemoglobin/transferrin/lactoferrin receptor protein
MRRIALITIAACLSAATCLSQSNGSAIVVTATRDERIKQSAPYYVDVITADMLRIDGSPRTLPEALKNQAGVLIQKTGHGQGSPYIRGFTGFRNLLLIDGVRLNNSVFRDGPNQYWNTVDTMSMQRIETVHGPFSMLYGTDAVGGTVNAITRGMSSLQPNSKSDRRLYYRYSDAEHSSVTRLESIRLLTDQLALSVSGTVKKFGDLEGGEDVGTQKKTGYDELDWDAKLEYLLTDDSQLVIAHQGTEIDDAWRTHKTIYGIDWEGLSVGEELHRILDQSRRLTYMQYHRQSIGGPVEELHAGISYHRQEEERDRLRTGERHDIQGFQVNTIGTFLQLESGSPVGQLVYGTELYRDNVDSFRNTLSPDGSIASTAIQGPVGDDATYDLLGVYLQDSITVSESVSLILGGRYDYAAADVDSVQSPDTGERMQIADSWDSVVGSGRVLYHMDDQKVWNLFAGLSQSFRAPNLSDLSRFDSARTDEIETPSPDLDPEEFTSAEIGIKSIAAWLSGQVSYFYTDMQDMIVRTPTGRMIDGENEVTKRNASEGYVHGVEVEVRVPVAANLTAMGNLTLMDGKVHTYPTSDPVAVEEYLDRLMPMTGTVKLRWNNDTKCWIEGSCTVAEKADKLSTRDKSDTSRIPPGGTPGYTVFDLRIGWRPSSEFTISAAVENLADQDYRIHGSGVNEPGRNTTISAEWMF